MTFFSDALVDDQFVVAIRRDLDRADVLRFLVAYISENGIKEIGINLLHNGLQSRLSFGIGSISCACGYEPLMSLQENLPLDPPRLKYFMDPALRKSDEPDDIALLHSKIVYLRALTALNTSGCNQEQKMPKQAMPQGKQGSTLSMTEAVCSYF